MPSPTLLILLLVPVLVGLAGWFWGGDRLTWWELAIQIVVVALLLLLGYTLGQWATVHDVEVWSGRVARKPHSRTKCCHSYRCHCHRSCTGTGGHRSCSTRCSTCYRHKFDLRWMAISDNNERVYVNKCNKPGTPTPLSWKVIRFGEPTAHEHGYDNFVRAAPQRFLRGSEALLARYRSRLPKYPRVFGHSALRFVTAGVSEPKTALYADALAKLNSDLFVRGKRQANLIIVVTSQAKRDFFVALQRHWLGGKRNDVVLVVSAPAYPKINWARVMAWTKDRGVEAVFTQELARGVEKLGTFKIKPVLALLKRTVIKHYKPLPQSYFKRVAGRVSPPGWVLAALFAGGLIVSGFLQLLFLSNRFNRRR